MQELFGVGGVEEHPVEAHVCYPAQIQGGWRASCIAGPD